MKRNLFLILMLVFFCTACGIGKQRTCGTFVSSAGETEVNIFSVQRMPDFLGGEKRVYAQRRLGSDASPEILFDINGRACRSLRADISSDQKWIRLYVNLDPPLVGESIPLKDGEGGRRFKSYARGETSVQDKFPYSVRAYINFDNQMVLRYFSATPDERFSILGAVRELPENQVLRGNMVEWNKATRK